MKRPIAPCKGCEERRPGCHGECDLYKTFRAALDEFNEQIQHDREIEAALNQFDYEQKRRRR